MCTPTSKGFYRFPAIKIRPLTPPGQIKKIDEEVGEALRAFNSILQPPENAAKQIEAYGMELLDVIHAAETALRMAFSDSEVEYLRDKVEKKNRERGYYG